ncbi:hypothetical protein ACJMK2_036740 [Sinanodonta woodiana]|uniref:SSD domain-containing protein n=1 Tax=Sinanodonta woodiana TaxID=1069815 RepID=A0ABD3WJI1_SINWO
MWCYARILAHYPYVVMVAVLIVTITSLIVTLTIGEKPNFEDPMVGFEPRGTEISNRLVAYTNLINNVNNLLSLTPSPSPPLSAVIQHSHNKLSVSQMGHQGNLTTEEKHNQYHRKKRSNSSQFFCDVPDGQYSKIVFHSLSNTLLTAASIHQMCAIEETQLHSHSLFQKYCLREDDTDQCCRSVSIGNYIALITNKSRCQDITDQDVKSVDDILKFCSVFYQNYSLADDCDVRHSPLGESRSDCSSVPPKCTQYNAVYNMFHFIVDSNFITSKSSLEFAVTFLPVSFHVGSQEKTLDAIDLYLSFEMSQKQFSDVEVVAADFGIKYSLFQHYLQKDSKWLAVGGSLIFLAVWLFTGSIFLTFTTFLAMFWSLEMAYFLYVFVFEIKFFPYLNLVTILMMIAIGADDVFIYTKYWHLAKKERNNGTLEKLVSDTLKHATLSMLVTSLTTAGAIFSNLVSPITSIKCFSIYAGTAIICNFILMITWIPASVVVQEKWCNFCYVNPPKMYGKYKEYYRFFFEKILPAFVIRLRYVWIILLGGMGVFGGVVVFHYPKLRLPTSFKFQVFRKDHLLEMYDQEVGYYFGFERALEENTPLLPIRIIWGIQETDNGNGLDPHEKGKLEFDPSFQYATSNAQIWFLKFCQNLRSSKFYQRISSVEYTNCFTEHFKSYLEQPCIQGRKDYASCCNESIFPFSTDVNMHCMGEYIPQVMKTPYLNYGYQSPGPRFTNDHISALIVEVTSSTRFSYSYYEIKDFYDTVNQWVTRQLLDAPPEVRNGWFISDLKYFMIQKSLVETVPLAFGISLVVSAVVTFFTSLNVLITLYAVVTIAAIMLVTTAALVLLGWELNILESVIITVAIGMSVDHTLHYGVAYQLSPELDRGKRVQCSIIHVGSVIFMAALTTFLPGALMMPSVTLVYQKFGIFLMLIISVSWTFSTLFFQSLLNVIGPQGGFGQFHWPSSDCCSMSPPERVDRTIYTMSESTLSSSSSSYPCTHTSSEGQEKDPLTERSEPHIGPSRHKSGRHRGQTRTPSSSPEVYARIGESDTQQMAGSEKLFVQKQTVV